MDPQKFREAYQKLDYLDERLTHKIRPRESLSATHPSVDQVDSKLRELANYTLELKDIMRELFLAIAGKPAAKPPG